MGCESHMEDGIAVFVKYDCPTCLMVVPVLEKIQKTVEMKVFVQDYPEKFPSLMVDDDRELLKVVWSGARGDGKC